MARFHFNIEPSAFRRGVYVGYGAGKVWRIVKASTSYGNWAARPQVEDMRVPTIFAHTLADMSRKLSNLV